MKTIAKLTSKFEVEFEINEGNKAIFDALKLNGFKEMKDGLLETLKKNSNGIVNILEFEVTE